MKKLILLALLLPTVSAVHPTLESKAQILKATSVGFSIPALITVVAAYIAEKQAEDPKPILAIGGAVSVGVALLSGFISSFFTPDANFNSAKSILNNLDHQLIDACKNVHHNTDGFFRCIKKSYFDSAYPLRKAFNTLTSYHTQLQQAESFLHKAKHNREFARECYQLLDEIPAVKFYIQEANIALKEHPNWVSENKAYAEEQARLERERIAWAQVHAQQQTAWAQQNLAYEAHQANKRPPVHNIFVNNNR
ncbi:hypothetical protein HOM50_01100 [bacterium]|jgi:hypothetical protein|nr:hypothetical protein [bacterium]MBT5014988.1 hypothetical protein [bacterium]